MAMPPRGTVIRLTFDPTVGHQQAGQRPAIVVSDETQSRHMRFPLLGVIPLTTTKLAGPLYPSVRPDTRGVAALLPVIVSRIRSRIREHPGSELFCWVWRITDTPHPTLFRKGRGFPKIERPRCRAVCEPLLQVAGFNANLETLTGILSRAAAFMLLDRGEAKC